MERTASWRDETSLGELVLKIRHEDDAAQTRSAALILDGAFLMDSESCASEYALARRGAEEALERVSSLRTVSAATDAVSAWGALRVLVGGLGLGLTLQALLEYENVRYVQVVELFGALIDWNRLHLGWLNNDALTDKRVFCQAGDLVSWLRAVPDSKNPAMKPYDLILLDIDNGPTWLSRPANENLYSEAGLASLRPWLSPEGLAVFWATEIAPEFEQRLNALSWASWRREMIPCEPKRQQHSRGEMNDVLYYLCLKTD